MNTILNTWISPLGDQWSLVLSCLKPKMFSNMANTFYFYIQTIMFQMPEEKSSVQEYFSGLNSGLDLS